MARRTSRVKRASISKTVAKTREEKGRLFNLFGLSESYTSLFLGIVVVIIAAVLLIAFVRNLNFQKTPSPAPEISSTKIEPETKQTQVTTPKEGTIYTVRAGDDLWSIAEKVYKDGYSWVKIAQANGLQNPNIIYVGTKLIIPSVSPIKSATYTVQAGDTLWSIAERRYNDGYRWLEIARTNKLTNPDVIHVGNVLRLP
jgi:nucleoid-associated protein YgaU